MRDFSLTAVRTRTIYRNFYAIGNSLTNDLALALFPSLVANSGNATTIGYHIRAGQPLAFIVANPGNFTFVDPFQWNVALPATQRNFLSMQPYTGSTLGAELDAIPQFSAVTASIAPVRNYIYEGWPATTSFGSDYQAYWAQPVVDSLSTLSILQREFFEHVCTRARVAFPKTFIIPTGDVFNRMDIEARAGNIPGAATVADFYRDALHMGTVGRFVAASTFFATMYHKQSTASQATVDLYQALGGSTLTLTLALAQFLEPIIFSVVQSYPYSGLTA